jgi:hypothetical protein
MAQPPRSLSRPRLAPVITVVSNSSRISASLRSLGKAPLDVELPANVKRTVAASLMGNHNLGRRAVQVLRHSLRVFVSRLVIVWNDVDGPAANGSLNSGVHLPLLPPLVVVTTNPSEASRSASFSPSGSAASSSGKRYGMRGPFGAPFSQPAPFKCCCQNFFAAVRCTRRYGLPSAVL